MTLTFDPHAGKPALQPGDVAVVAGGRGFVGSHIVRALLDFGCKVHVLGPSMAHDLLAGVAGRYGSVDCGVQDEDAVRAALMRLRPAAVVSCAAFGAGGEGLMRAGERDAGQALRINVDGLRILLDASRNAGVRQAVWTSSTTLYGDAADYGASRVDENAPPGPRTFYGLTKQLAEAVAVFDSRRHAWPVIALRLPLILGPGLWYQGAAAALAAAIKAARPGARHSLDFHDEPIDIMHVADVAAAVLQTLRHSGALDPVYNINGFTMRAAEMAGALQRRVPDFRIELRRQQPARLFPLIDDSRFRRDTGFTPRIGLSELISTMSTEQECAP
jgi:UDP-glucose 4-epimerase